MDMPLLWFIVVTSVPILISQSSTEHQGEKGYKPQKAVSEGQREPHCSGFFGKTDSDPQYSVPDTARLL